MAKKSIDIETKAQPAGATTENGYGYTTDLTGGTVVERLNKVPALYNDINGADGTGNTTGIKKRLTDVEAKLDGTNFKANGEPFKFGYKDEEYGYYIGETFHPFSNARALYEALQYSPLAPSTETNYIYEIEQGDTYKELCAAVANYFPNSTDLDDYTKDTEGKSRFLHKSEDFGTGPLLRAFEYKDGISDTDVVNSNQGGRSNIITYYEYDRWVMQFPSGDSSVYSYIVFQDFASKVENFKNFDRMRIKGYYLALNSNAQAERTFKVDKCAISDSPLIGVPSTAPGANNTPQQQQTNSGYLDKITGNRNSKNYWTNVGAWEFKEGSVDENNHQISTLNVIPSIYAFEVDTEKANQIRFSKSGRYSYDIVFCTISFYTKTSAT